MTPAAMRRLFARMEVDGRQRLADEASFDVRHRDLCPGNDTARCIGYRALYTAAELGQEKWGNTERR